jgi:hypothetical protein
MIVQRDQINYTYYEINFKRRKPNVVAFIFDGKFQLSDQIQEIKLKHTKNFKEL